MANEYLFAGGRLDSFTTSGTPTEATTAGYFDSSFSDCAVSVANTDKLVATFQTVSGSTMAAADVVSGELCSVHWVYYSTQATSSTSTNVAELKDSSGYAWLALRLNSSANGCGLYYNSGSGASPTWTQIGASATIVSGALNTFDMQITLGSPHAASLSQNGSLLVSGTFTQASLISLRSFTLGAQHASTSRYTYYSQVLCARGISTVGSFVKSTRPTGAGSNSGWTGAYTDVNTAIGSDATTNSAATASLSQSYAMGDVSLGGGLSIATVFNTFRAKNDGSTPVNIQSLIKSGATTYASGNLTVNWGTSYAGIQMRYNVDPATSAAWTQSGWNAAEAGFKSIT